MSGYTFVVTDHGEVHRGAFAPSYTAPAHVHLCNAAGLRPKDVKVGGSQKADGSIEWRSESINSGLYGGNCNFAQQPDRRQRELINHSEMLIKKGQFRSW